MLKKCNVKADVIVIGSGPGGATVARDLTLKGKKVLILERGGDHKPAGTLLSAFQYIGGFGFFGKGMLISKEGYQMVRCITTGGTSMMYLGCAWDPPPEMFARYGIDLQTEVDEIKSELHVQPIPDDIIGPRAHALTKSATDLGHPWQKVPKFVKTENCRADCNRCYYGCPHKAKWHARDWVLDAVENGGRLMNRMYCDRVLIQDDQAVGVIAVDQQGTRHEINANAVVVSAGGVGSPAVLQRTGIYDAGRTFFFDPFICAFGEMDKAYKPAREFPMVTGMHLPDDGIMITDMPLPWGVFANYALLGLKPQKLLKNGNRVGMLIKVRDDMEGAISMTEKIASKPLTPDDLYKLNKGRSICQRILQNMGANNIWFSMEAAAHPGGTCRIGHVVDENLETRFKNLFVADASVIPEPWGLPPTLAITALARRLSKHLEGKI